MRHRVSNTNTKTFRRQAHCWLRILLLASFWHAPIPWIHIHAVSGAAIQSNSRLARHLDEFHPEIADFPESELGWHWHLVLPWDMGHQGDCHFPSGCQPADEGVAALKYASVCTLDHGLGLFPVRNCPPDRNCSPTLTERTALGTHTRIELGSRPGASGSYFGTFIGSVSICDLIDRHLC